MQQPVTVQVYDLVRSVSFYEAIGLQRERLPAVSSIDDLSFGRLGPGGLPVQFNERST